MPGPDLKDKEITDTSPADSGEGEWTPDDDQAYQNEYDRAQQQKAQNQPPPDPGTKQNSPSPQQGEKLTGKAAKQARAEAWKRGKKKLLEKAAKKGGKWAAKTATKEGAKKAVTAAASAAGSEVPVVGNIAAGAAAEGVMNTAEFGAKEAARFIKNPQSIFTRPGELINEGVNKSKKWLIIISVGIFVFIQFFVVFFGGGAGWANDQGLFEEEDTESLLTITQNGPATAKNGDILSYTVTVSYPNPFGDIRLVNRIPTGTQYVPNSASQKVTCNNGQICNESSRFIYWYAKQNNLTTNPMNTSFTYRLRAVSVPNNSKLPNIITGTVIPATTSAQTE